MEVSAGISRGPGRDKPVGMSLTLHRELHSVAVNLMRENDEAGGSALALGNDGSIVAQDLRRGSCTGRLYIPVVCVLVP